MKRYHSQDNPDSIYSGSMRGDDELFAEKFQKFTVREFKNNTRMNINNANVEAQRLKRERAINYWQQQVI